MINAVVPLGIAWLLLRNKEDKVTDPTLDPDIDDDSELPEERPDEQVWTKTAKWVGEYATTGTGGDQVVWFLNMGIRYADGTADFSSTTYIVIGNKNHTSFLRANSDRGTVDIAKEYTGGTQDMDNVVVFASLADAEARADELANPTPPDPNDPTQPQPQPEEEDKPTPPSLPTQPSFPSFGGESSYGF